MNNLNFMYPGQSGRFKEQNKPELFSLCEQKVKNKFYLNEEAQNKDDISCKDFNKNSTDKMIRILIVEDNKSDACICLQMLQTKNYFIVNHVQDLNSALDVLSNQNFELILLDLTLPEAEDFNTFNQIRQFSPNIPIIIMTGVDNEELAIKIVQAGAQDYLVKGKFNTDLLIRAIRYSIERQKLIDKIYTLSLTDDLTGLYNRRAFFMLAERYHKLAERENNKLLLFFIDLDNMKKINDTYGHLQGDTVLKTIGDILKNTFRESDIIARIGGDEFVILMKIVDPNDYTNIISRFKENIANFNYKKILPYTISLSIGGAISGEEEYSIQGLIANADKALYEHKSLKNDKNRDFIILHS